MRGVVQGGCRWAMLIVGIGLVIYHQIPVKEHLPEQEEIAVTQLVVKPEPQYAKLALPAYPETATEPVQSDKSQFRSVEDLRFATAEGATERMDVGLLSQSLLAELCDIDMSLQHVMTNEMFNRLWLVFAVHPKAAEHIKAVEEELRIHEDCTDPQAWVMNTHRALLQRGLLDSPIDPEIEMMLNAL